LSRETHQRGGEPKIITKEKVVLIKETDVVADAVKSAIPALVAIFEVMPPEKTDTPLAEPLQDVPKEVPKDVTKPEYVFRARGVFIGGSIVASDAGALEDGKKYIVRSIASGTDTEVKEMKVVKNIAYLTLEQSNGSTVALAQSSDIQLGQTLIILGGESRLRVTTGIISDLERSEGGAITALSVGTDATPGASLLTMDGKLLALSIAGAWVPADIITQ
jgi:S1-C subfamily serine protease